MFSGGNENSTYKRNRKCLNAETVYCETATIKHVQTQCRQTAKVKGV